MKQHWGALLLLLALAVVLVQSQTRIEVDENGDEIEVKRFYIEGRQLNGGRRQCVETRRRRRAANYDAAPTNNADDSASRQDDEVQMSPTTPATGVEAATSPENEDHKGNDEIGLIGLFDDTNFNAGAINVAHDVIANANDDDDDDDDDVLSSTLGHQHVSAAAHAGPNGIVVVQTNNPPKVNPQTHAVFELLPVNGNADDDYDDLEGGDQLLFEEEVSPISTTAIWSTGADDKDDYNDLTDEELDELYGDYDEKPAKGDKKPKPKPKPSKSSRPKRPKNGGNKRKPARKGRPSKKRKSTPPKNRPGQKRRRPGNKNKRKLPARAGMVNNNNKRRRRPVNQYTDRMKADRQREGTNGLRKQNNRRVNANLANRNINRKNTNNSDKLNQGTNTFTKTETVTQTGTANDEKDVNCIIINKDPPTTQRPFWNILGIPGLGRNADGDDDAHASRQFGKRKRVNMRFKE